jgi:LysR family transcriptional regulator, regulator for genes of the gallate degradation pathway
LRGCVVYFDAPPIWNASDDPADDECRFGPIDLSLHSEGRQCDRDNLMLLEKVLLGDEPNGEVSVAAPGEPATFRQIKLFEAVGRLGNVTRAAQECGLSQPAATQSLATLQSRTGLPLILGKSKRTVLTAQGRLLLEIATQILGRLERALTQAGAADPKGAIWHLTALQLRLLDATRLHGTLELAALSTGVTSRTAVRAIRTLEQRTAIALLKESGEGLILSGSGTVLAQRIGLLADDLDWTIASLRDAAERESRTIVIGVAPDPGTAAVGPIVKAQLEANPGRCIELIEAGQDDLLTRLAVGEIDLVIGHILDHPHRPAVWEHLATARFRVVARHGHPLAQKPRASLAELASQQWLLGARGSQRRAATDILFARHAQPEVALITSAPPLMAQIMADSDLIALMTDHELDSRREVLTEIGHQAPDIPVRIGWASRPDWVPTEFHEDFVDHLKLRFATLPNEAERLKS